MISAVALINAFLWSVPMRSTLNTLNGMLRVNWPDMTASHVPADKSPFEHDVACDGQYPSLQEMVHSLPDARFAVQVPAVPFTGEALASHGLTT